VDDLRGTPMSVGTLEEIIDDNHAIVSTSVGSEHYVSILSFVDKDQLEPGCSVLLNHKVCCSAVTEHRTLCVHLTVTVTQSTVSTSPNGLLSCLAAGAAMCLAFSAVMNSVNAVFIP